MRSRELLLKRYVEHRYKSAIHIERNNRRK
jgi:hypothetical protein